MKNNNIVLWTKQFENFIPKVNGKFRFYSDGSALNCEGGRATILPTAARIKSLGGIEHSTMAYGYGIKVVKRETNEPHPFNEDFDWNFYYEFDRLETSLLSDYFKHTGNVFVIESTNGSIVPIGPAEGYNRQYESTFNLKLSK
jgi:hypothetical protein